MLLPARRQPRSANPGCFAESWVAAGSTPRVVGPPGSRPSSPGSAPRRVCDKGGANFSSAASLGVVIATNGHRPGPEVTRALIAEIAGGELGAKLRSQVAAWHPGAGREDVEEAFQEACVLAQRRCRGQREGEVFTWLRTTTLRELGHIRKRAGRRARR